MLVGRFQVWRKFIYSKHCKSIVYKLSQKRSFANCQSHRSIAENVESKRELVRDHLRVFQLVREYESKGHLIADLDPLKLAKDNPFKAPFTIDQVDALRKETYGFTDDDLDRTFYVDGLLGDYGPECTLRDLLSFIQKAYCGAFSCEFMHMKNEKAIDWIRNQILTGIFKQELAKKEKLDILKALLEAQLFEEFCGKRFSGAKRFSLEGCESLIPGLNELFRAAAEHGVNTIEMGMAHRGRLNVLFNSLGIPIEALLHNFQTYLPDDNEHPNNSDDVRYHLGTTQLLTFNDHRIRVSLTANPSHLEAVNSVVLGKTRARQFLLRGDLDFYISESPLGKVGGDVDYSPSDFAKQKCMAVLIHGDASFFQGSVREAMGFSNLRDYTTGGTVHIIINNQIGFTTMPHESHSSLYCSDVATSIGAPIFHVNGDCPEKVAAVFKVAVAYRQQFGKDCVINLWCYRRHGHNEQDKPEITQPLMYKSIRNHERVTLKYFKALEKRHTITKDWFEKTRDQIYDMYMHSYENLQLNSKVKGSFITLWNEIGQKHIESEENYNLLEEVNTEECIPIACELTGVDAELLQSYGRAIFTLPDSNTISLHPIVRKVHSERLQSIQRKDTKSISWAGAEALAFASLLIDGYHIRLSGQDVERGTFNQRHAVLYDQELSIDGEERIYKPWTALQTRKWHSEDMRRALIRQHSDKRRVSEPKLEEMPNDVKEAVTELHLRILQRNIDRLKLLRKTKKIVESRTNVQNNTLAYVPTGAMEICNSPLSEEAVLGFEHGYSIYSPTIMTIWEAQFGDFANCAQTMIDTFIASGEEKWARSSGLVMLLPHGFEGQGPDHSSARVERFLQLCSEDETPSSEQIALADEYQALSKANMHVLVPSTPAQYFHALRRQMLLPFRKPLVLITPKHLLHHKPCSSSLKEMDSGTFFLPVLHDQSLRGHGIRRLVLCTGKIYYHLIQARRMLRLDDDVAIIRIEQLCPFPFYSLQQILKESLTNDIESIVWAQEEPKNMGCWTYIRPRILECLRRIRPNKQMKLEYKGRPPSASPATGSFQLHCDEMARLTKDILSGNL